MISDGKGPAQRMSPFGPLLEGIPRIGSSSTQGLAAILARGGSCSQGAAAARAGGRKDWVRREPLGALRRARGPIVEAHSLPSVAGPRSGLEPVFRWDRRRDRPAPETLAAGGSTCADLR